MKTTERMTQFEWKDKIYACLVGARIIHCQYVCVSDLELVFGAGPKNSKIGILTFRNSESEILVCSDTLCTDILAAARRERPSNLSTDIFLNKAFASQEIKNTRFIDLSITTNQIDDLISLFLIGPRNFERKTIKILNPDIAMIELIGTST